jgi:glucokinase
LGGIGIGASGPVDRALGAIQNPHTLPTWENVDVVTPLSSRFGVPVALENDADIAILGEYWVGAGRGCTRLAMVTVGTGIGLALMADGKLYRGARGYHPEGGHIVLDPHGPLCYCGANGCWESLASGTAIGRLAREREAVHPGSLLERVNGNLDEIDADIVGQAAEAGDASAREVIDQAAYYLGLGLVNVIGMFFPEVIVLGGGVMRRFDLMQPRIMQTLARHVVMVRASDARIELARLGIQAGVFGAAYAVLQELE